MLSALVLLTLGAAPAAIPAYKDPKAPVEARVADLLGRMSLDEKLRVLQISSDPAYVGALGIGALGFMNNGLDARASGLEYNALQRRVIEGSRLGVPAIRQGEGLFAYMGNGSTAFPQSIALASSFDPDVVARMASALAVELRSRGVRQVFAPVLNIARDPRWGRTGETYGEDPYLTGEMGVAYVRAMEAKGIVTTPKHFAANMGLDGRFASPVHFSERLLREVYFPAFEACFRRGGAKSVMMAYNTLDGVPCATNRWLMTDVIKKEWGFDGFVVSDGGGLQIALDAYGVASTREEIAAAAMNAGCDVSLSDGGDFYGAPLREALRKGTVSISAIDESARRVLRQVFRTGLFDHPYVDPDEAARVNGSAEHRRLALDLARRSLVLLKNDGRTLPFRKDVRKVAVVGPLADALLVNHYGGWGRHEVTVLEGVRRLLPSAEVAYARGAEVAYLAHPAVPASAFPEGLTAEYFANPRLEGVPAVTRHEESIEHDWKEGGPESLPVDGFSARFTGRLRAPRGGRVRFGLTMDDGARLYLDGRLVIDAWQNGGLRLAEAEYTLEAGRTYDLRVEFYDSAHRASVQLGWDLDPFAGVAKAAALAREADAVVAVVGMRDDENLDRADLDLDPAQERLVHELAATGKPLAVVIQSGTVITAHDWIDEAPAVLVGWYPGEEGGNAIAEALFGDVNPGGKLPVTFPKVTGQVPIHYNRLPGKPQDAFIGVGNEPQFPFGHGLSYTTFEISGLRLGSPRIRRGESASVSVEVRNTGAVAGDEVVQLYLHDVVASVSRPVLQLAGFRRVRLGPGETRSVAFTIEPDQLALYDARMKRVVEPGDFEVMVGASSADIRQRTTLTVVD